MEGIDTDKGEENYNYVGVAFNERNFLVGNLIGGDIDSLNCSCDDKGVILDGNSSMAINNDDDICCK